MASWTLSPTNNRGTSPLASLPCSTNRFFNSLSGTRPLNSKGRSMPVSLPNPNFLT
ncbi:unannotated protein [freshwater metagenome]|uniref:Unannotated protein n=1 Tax=freshwater metagenome TaxID=449393 RepID=A0A6J7FXF5_9ZZZZ